MFASCFLGAAFKEYEDAPQRRRVRGEAKVNASLFSASLR